MIESTASQGASTTVVASGSTQSRTRAGPLTWALLALAIAAAWQWLTVSRNFGSHLTALFCAGALTPLPPGPPFDQAYRFPNSHGFDGQFYFMIARDPWVASDVWTYLDLPEHRYRRILLPALTALLSGNRPDLLAATYVLLNLAFLLGAAWCLGRYAQEQGRSPAWALAVFLIPAVLIALDRQVVELSATALLLGSVLAHRLAQRWWVALLLGLSLLARETGVLLITAFVAYELLHRRLHTAVLYAASSIPAGLWFFWLRQMHWPRPFRTPEQPFQHLWMFLRQPPEYDLDGVLTSLVRASDYAALAGLLLGMAWCWRERDDAPMCWAAWLFSAAGLTLLALDDWTHVYDFGRVLSPIPVFLLLRSLEGRNWWLLLPGALMSARVVVQIAPQILGVLGWASH